MKLGRRSLWYFLFAGSAMLSLSACNEIDMTLSKNQKVVLHPSKGDQLKWENLQVKFLLHFCATLDAAPWTSTCKVDVDTSDDHFAQYNYICKGGACVDPELDVGSALQNPLKDVKMNGPAAGDYPVGLPCDGGKIDPMPPAVNADFYGQPVTPNHVILWQSQGTNSGTPPQFLLHWTVKFTDGSGGDITGTVCKESSIPSPNGICTLQSPGTYTYTASAPPSSNCASMTGTVTVTPSQN